jgi:hypothetical protein
MEINYELTEKDFRDAIIAHRNRTKSSKWAYRLLGILFLLGLAINLAGILIRPIDRSLPGDIPIAIIMLLGLIALWWWPRFAARTQFLKQPSAHGIRTVSLDSEGVHWRWSGGASDFEWKNFVRFVESKDHFLIYSSPAIFSIIPKRVLTLQEISDLRAFLAQYLSSAR